MTPYTDLIKEILKKKKRDDIDPRHVEAFMRVQYHALDHLSKAEFEKETDVCIGCINEAGKTISESVAVSHGL